MIQDTITYLKVRDTENTKTALEIAVKTAYTNSISNIVIASTGGETARVMADEVLHKDLQVTVVTHAYGQAEPGKNPMPEELRNHLKEQGFNICTAAHVLSGAERSLSKTFGGVYPVEIIANTLRMFGQGMKVCVEISAMAADAGYVVSGEPVVAVGGTGHGADTVVILRPEASSNILKTKIDRIVCKPIE